MNDTSHQTPRDRRQSPAAGSAADLLGPQLRASRTPTVPNPNPFGGNRFGRALSGVERPLAGDAEAVQFTAVGCN